MDLDSLLHDRGSPGAPSPAVPGLQVKKPGRKTRPRSGSQGTSWSARSRESSYESNFTLRSPSQADSHANLADGSTVLISRRQSVDSGGVSRLHNAAAYPVDSYPGRGAFGPGRSGGGGVIHEMMLNERTRLIGVSSMPQLPRPGPSPSSSRMTSPSLRPTRSPRDPPPAITRLPSGQINSNSSINDNRKGPGGQNPGGGGSGTAVAAPERQFGFSRRKAPIAPAVRYLMETVCTDLIACGECFVPDDKAGQTLVPYGSFVPIEVDEAMDSETTHFMEGRYEEAYGRGVGLPGLAWTSGKPMVVDISTLSSDPSFESGGDRLSHTARLFHTALTIPLYSAEGIFMFGIVDFRQLMGVVVVYFPAPENHATALIAYASSVAASASAVSELMVHRSLFVEGRANRVKRNWRVMRIAILFAAPMFIRYREMTGKTVVDTVQETNQPQIGSVVNIALADPDDAEAGSYGSSRSTFRTPRHQLSIKKSLRRPIQQTVMPPGASAVLASREAAEKKMATTGGGLTDWLAQYFAKTRGGPVHMPDPARPRDALLSWFGAFMGIGIADMVVNILNGSFEWRGQDDLFVLSGSFGALSTLVYALPAVPLAQPRVVFSAHAMAMSASMVAISVFERGRLVWLQKALTVSSVILGMCLTGVVHPPAGALCLVFVGAYNQGATHERLEMLVVSVVMGLLIHVGVAIFVNNLSPRRQYPVFW